MNNSVKISLIVAATLIFFSLIADVVVANWTPTLAVVGAMAVAGLFTGINLLARGEENSVAKNAESTAKIAKPAIAKTAQKSDKK